MKTTVDWSDFTRGFELSGRSDQFTRDGLRALYDYLTELEQDCGIDLEFDVVGLCCEFTEYASILDAALQNGWECDPMDPDDDGDAIAEAIYTDDCKVAALEYLLARTQVILVGEDELVSGSDNPCIIQDF